MSNDEVFCANQESTTFKDGFNFSILKSAGFLVSKIEILESGFYVVVTDIDNRIFSQKLIINR